MGKIPARGEPCLPLDGNGVVGITCTKRDSSTMLAGPSILTLAGGYPSLVHFPLRGLTPTP